jgi:D-glycerate 3-kinase
MMDRCSTVSPRLEPTAVELIVEAARPALAAASGRPFILGLCGAQGSGKSTAAVGVKRLLERDGHSAAILSLDDLYLPRMDRERLARFHPLLRTRGVPGTHDVDLGIATVGALGQPGRVGLPRFSKADDDRIPRDRWDEVDAPVDVLIFEGWCVGARPQLPECLDPPVNALEAMEDPDGRWRRYVNDALAGNYQALFVSIDMLVLLAAPQFAVVASWRLQQEQELRIRSAEGPAAAGIMTEEQVGRFVMHYQRLTEHILTEMPDRADLVIRLDAGRGCRLGVQHN